MTTTIKSSVDGTKSYLDLNGATKVTIGATGIEAGSYAPDSITAAELAPGALLETSPLYGIGYGPGAGGTVTQATSKSTAVTLNKPCGKITTHNASLANGAAVSFTVNNSLVGPNDTVIATAGAAFVAYLVTAKTGNTGSFEIVLRNLTGSAHAEAVVINFAIIKGATS